jgi:cytochrome b561
MAYASRFHPLLVALHWLLAMLIIAALALGNLVMIRLPNTDPMKFEALRFHMSGGILIGISMLVRLGVRSRTRHPASAATRNPALDRLAWLSHRMLYLLVFAMVFSGGAMALQSGLPAVVFGNNGNLPADFWIYPARSVHYLVSRLLMALIAVHVAGALYHTLILKDGLLQRMWFGTRVAARDMTPDPSAVRKAGG